MVCFLKAESCEVQKLKSLRYKTCSFQVKKTQMPRSRKKRRETFLHGMQSKMLLYNSTEEGEIAV